MSLLCLDVGTRSVRALVFSDTAQLLFNKSLSISIQRNGLRVEQNGAEILRKLRVCIYSALDACSDIHIAGLSCQRASVLAWSATAQPLSPVYSWQDTRNADAVTACPLDLRERTGLVASAHYGASKLALLKDTETDFYGPLASFLVHALTGVCACDHSIAQRMQYWNINSQAYDDDILNYWRLNKSKLPPLCDSLADYGKIDTTGIAIKLCIGDQNAAAYAYELSDTQALINLGSGGFLLQPLSDDFVLNRQQLFSVFYSHDGHMSFLHEAAVNAVASSFSWAYQHYRLSCSPNDITRVLEDRLIQPPCLLNAPAGLAAPWWHSGEYFEWLDSTISIKNNPDLSLKALIESFLFMLAINLRQGPLCSQIILSGGVGRSEAIAQYLANITGLPVAISSQTEASAFGLARLLHPDLPPASLTKHYSPHSDPSLDARFQRFELAISRFIKDLY